MAYPFFPAGAITATLVLGGTPVLSRMLLFALDRGAAELRGSIGPGLVRGVKAWVDELDHPGVSSTSQVWRPPGNERHAAEVPLGWSMPAGVILEDLTAPSEIDLETVRPHS